VEELLAQANVNAANTKRTKRRTKPATIIGMWKELNQSKIV